MSRWWCRHGATWCIVDADSQRDAEMLAFDRFVGPVRSFRDRTARRAQLHALGPVTVRRATAADEAVWADYLAFRVGELPVEPTPVDGQESLL